MTKRHMSPRYRRNAAVWAAAAAVLLTGCEFKGLYDVQLPGGAAADGDAYRVTVHFRDVLDLVPQSTVKVNNVTVGAVEEVELDGWHARVRLRVDDSVKLPGNAIAELRQTSMLGEKYVALSAPTDAAPVGRLGDGAVIPLSRSGRNPEIEEVLSALSALLNGGGVAQLKTITVELNKALEGRENRVKALLSELDTFIGGLDRQRAQIVRALQGIDRLAATLRREKATIGQALDTVPPALKVLAEQRTKLTAMLTSLSQLGATGTRVVNASRDDLVANLRSLQPILTQLNKAGADLPNALELLTTYPFPRNVVDAIKGDYVNLKVTADLDLTSIYGNLAPKPGGQTPRPPVPDLPGMPEIPGVPSVPSLPPTPSTPSAPQVPGAPAPSATPAPLCPPVCTATHASHTAQDGDGTGAGNDGPGDDGINPALVELLLKGLGL